MLNREVYFYLLKKLKTITSDNKHMNIHIFIKSRTIIIYRGVEEFINREYSLS